MFLEVGSYNEEADMNIIEHVPVCYFSHRR